MELSDGRPWYKPVITGIFKMFKLLLVISWTVIAATILWAITETESWHILVKGILGAVVVIIIAAVLAEISIWANKH